MEKATNNPKALDDKRTRHGTPSSHERWWVQLRKNFKRIAIGGEEWDWNHWRRIG
jgi:hypothetical protein